MIGTNYFLKSVYRNQGVIVLFRNIKGMILSYQIIKVNIKYFILLTMIRVSRS